MNKYKNDVSILSLCYFLLTILIFSYSAIGSDRLIFSGSAYSDLSLMHYVEKKNDSTNYSGTSALELKLRNSNVKFAKISAELDVYLLYGGTANAFLKYSKNSNLSSVAKLEDTPVRLNLRELYLAIYPSFADISIGRQIINFSQGFILSPIDVFSSVNITDLNFKRSGSDVINIRIPIGTLSEINLIKELPIADNEHSTAVKTYTNLQGVDLSLIGIYRHKSKETIFGTTFKGDLITGLYGEFVWHITENRKKSYPEFMTGADYSLLSNALQFTLEYSYNGYPDIGDSVSIQRFMELNRTLIKKHYLFFNVSYSVNELLSLSANMLCNIQDSALLGNLIARYSLMQNVSTTAYIRGFHKNINGLYIKQPDLEYALRIEVYF